MGWTHQLQFYSKDLNATEMCGFTSGTMDIGAHHAHPDPRAEPPGQISSQNRSERRPEEVAPQNEKETSSSPLPDIIRDTLPPEQRAGSLPRPAEDASQNMGGDQRMNTHSCSCNSQSIMVTIPLEIRLGCPNCNPSMGQTVCRTCNFPVGQIQNIQPLIYTQQLDRHTLSCQGPTLQLNLPISTCTNVVPHSNVVVQNQHCTHTQAHSTHAHGFHDAPAQTLGQKQSKTSKKRDSKSSSKVVLTTEQIKDRQQTCLNLVKQCGFYHGALSMEAARKLLRKTTVGSFLLRDSSKTRFPFSLSVKTERGTTSIRISFEHGLYRLDCDANAMRRMQSFECVLKLIDYYVESARADNANACVFLESSGRKDTPVLLIKPFLSQPRSLKHSARIVFNGSFTEEQRKRFLTFEKPDIETFLKAYPNKV